MQQISRTLCVIYNTHNFQLNTIPWVRCCRPRSYPSCRTHVYRHFPLYFIEHWVWWGEHVPPCRLVKGGLPPASPSPLTLQFLHRGRLPNGDSSTSRMYLITWQWIRSVTRGESQRPGIPFLYDNPPPPPPRPGTVEPYPHGWWWYVYCPTSSRRSHVDVFLGIRRLWLPIAKTSWKHLSSTHITRWPVSCIAARVEYKVKGLVAILLLITNHHTHTYLRLVIGWNDTAKRGPSSGGYNKEFSLLWSWKFWTLVHWLTQWVLATPELTFHLHNY